MLCALCLKNEQRLHRQIEIALQYIILFSRVTLLRHTTARVGVFERWVAKGVGNS